MRTSGGVESCVGWLTAARKPCARLVAAVVLCCPIAALADQPPPVVGAEGATLQDIVGTTTLVTVVLSTTGAQDKNLRVVELHDGYFSALTEDNQHVVYLFSSVKEIRVQGGEVETKKFEIDEARTLRPEEVKVVQRAYARAREIFDSSNDNQGVKMQAAGLIALNKDAQGRKYLEELAAANDVATAIQAAWHLYLAGDYTPAPELLTKGLQSGNRKVKTKAALLSGLAGDTSNESVLMTMVQDRSADLAKYGAWALTLLGDRECIPTLISMITQLDQDKGRAAIFGLSKLGGEDVIEEMKVKYKTAAGETRLRIAEVLYALGDPTGRDVLTKDLLPNPTLGEQAALFLAREGQFDAQQLLRSRLAQPASDLIEKLKYRADATGALIVGGDLGVVSELQVLLRSDKPDLIKHVCLVITKIGRRQLLPITQPTIEASKSDVALAACTAAIAIANPNDFRERLLKTEM